MIYTYTQDGLRDCELECAINIRKLGGTWIPVKVEQEHYRDGGIQPYWKAKKMAGTDHDVEAMRARREQPWRD